MSASLRAVSLLLFTAAVMTLCQEDALTEFLRLREGYVAALADHAEHLHERAEELVNDRTCARHGCANDFEGFGSCVTHLGTPPFCKVAGRLVDPNSTIFRIPPTADHLRLTDTLKQDISVYKHIVNVTQEHGNPEDTWAYVGTVGGVFVKFPATADLRGLDPPAGDSYLNGCAIYDPRLRPWFISASTGPKDIVLVLDKSGSMDRVASRINGDDRSRWDVVTGAVSTMLDTLSFTDYVNIVTFSDEATALWEKTGLVSGEAENIESLKRALGKAAPDGNTNFTAGFEKAFSLLSKDCKSENPSCSNCHKVILFLTDGKDTSGQEGTSIKPSEIHDRIEQFQADLEEEMGIRAVIFTYSITLDADDNIPRQIACASGGAWSFLDLYTNPLDALNAYYLYLAAGRKGSFPVWTEPYEDFGGLGMVTTVAVPFFAKGDKGDPDIFLGVAGKDVTISSMEAVPGRPTPEAILHELILRSEGCGFSEESPCERQLYRSSAEQRAVCADTFPVVDESGENPVPLCYEYSDRFYRRSLDNLSWSSAKKKCQKDGGRLVCIEDREKLAFLSGLASPDGSWVGATKSSPSNFSWICDVEDLDNFSEFWGLGESIHGRLEDCAAIDARGIIANLFAAACDMKLSYICEFKTPDPCLARGEIPEKGYFEIPSLEACAETGNQIRAQVQPVNATKDIKTSEVICPFGPNKTSEDVICCRNP